MCRERIRHYCGAEKGVKTISLPFVPSARDQPHRQDAKSAKARHILKSAASRRRRISREGGSLARVGEGVAEELALAVEGLAGIAWRVLEEADLLCHHDVPTLTYDAKPLFSNLQSEI
jgi:hypothetical protein